METISQEIALLTYHYLEEYALGEDTADIPQLLYVGLAGYDYNTVLQNRKDDLLPLIKQALDETVGKERETVNGEYIFDKITRPFWENGNACYDELNSLVLVTLDFVFWLKAHE